MFVGKWAGPLAISIAYDNDGISASVAPLGAPVAGLPSPFPDPTTTQPGGSLASGAAFQMRCPRISLPDETDSVRTSSSSTVLNFNMLPGPRGAADQVKQRTVNMVFILREIAVHIGLQFW